MEAEARRRALALRLAGPLQSWGRPSRHNRRETYAQPTKSGLVGLLAAAQGRSRGEDIADLVGLQLGIRVDQPGELLEDYHTFSDHRGGPMKSASVNAKGQQLRTSPPKPTGVTRRFYLQDAVFIAVLCGPAALVEALDKAVRKPYFPLALGRRSCPPVGPVSLGLRDETDPEQALRAIGWQVSDLQLARARSAEVTLAATVEDPAGVEQVTDVPDTFRLKTGTEFRERRVRHLWITLPTGRPADPSGEVAATAGHDPFALLGW